MNTKHEKTERSPITLLLARWSLFLIPAIIPIVTTNPSAWSGREAVTASFYEVPKLLAFSVLLAVAAVLWAVALLRGETQVRPPGTVGWLVATLLGVGVLSASFGIHPPTAWFGDSAYRQGLVVWIAYGLLWFLVVQLVAARADAVRAGWILVCAGTLVAAYDLAQVAWLDLGDWPGVALWMKVRGIGTIGNPDTLAGYLVAPLLLACAFAVGGQRRWHKVVAGFGIGTMSAAVVLTETRGAWVGVVLGACVLGVSIWRGHRSWVKAAAIGAVAALLVGAVGTLVLRPLPSVEIYRRLERLVGAGPHAGSGRLLMWREALSIIGGHPLLGVGPDSYRLAWYGQHSRALVERTGAGVFVGEPHSLLLQIAATFGLIGAAAAVAVLGLTLWRSRAAISGRELDTKSIPLAGWWVAVVGLVVYSMFGQATITIMSTLWFGLGVLAAAAARKPLRAATATKVALAAIVVLLSVSFVTIGTRTFAADVAMMDSQKPGMDAVALGLKARRLTPWAVNPRRWLAVAYANRAVDALGSGDRAGSAEWRVRAIAEYENALLYSPSDLMVYKEYAGSLAALAETRQAPDAEITDLADRGLMVDRWDVGLATMGAQALLRLGRPAEAVSMLEDRWMLDSAGPGAGGVYAQALAAAGNPEGAREVIEVLKARFPRDPTIPSVESTIVDAPSETD